jgi:hypothetical protein
MSHRIYHIFALLVLVGVSAATLVRTARADEASDLAARVKAAFVFNFAQFTEFPAETFKGDKTPLTIGVLGGNGFEDVLARTVAGKQHGGHPLVVKRAASNEDLAGCQMVFLSGDSAAIRSALAQTGPGVLTVSEDPAFTEMGGAIRLFMEDNKVRFEVNLIAVEKAKLQLSSKLLKLARNVIK